MDSLGNRMKKYEDIYRSKITPKAHYILRLDGRHFHTYMRGAKKPFDVKYIGDMVECARYLVKEIQGAEFAYVQSDEISIYLTDTQSQESQLFFDGNIQKIVSVSASMLTQKFNSLQEEGRKHAQFDARIFVVPKNEVPNYFIWRQRDWERNSLSMFCSQFFSHKELDGKSCAERHEMLHQIGENWCELLPILKNGTFAYKLGYITNDKKVYTDYEDMM